MKVILGTMTWGRASQTLKPKALEQLETILTFLGPEQKLILDTARVYTSGESEEIIGELVKENGLQSRVEIHTKANPNITKLSKEGVRQQLEQSLKALQMDCVDLFYLHSPDITTPLEETMQVCNDLYKEGKFKALGLSNYAAWDVVRAHYICKENGWVLPSVYQGCYNMVNRTIEAELLPALRTLNMSFYAYNPLAAGLLTGRYKTLDDLKNSAEGRFSSEFDFASRDPKKTSGHPYKGIGGKMYQARYAYEDNFKALQILEKIVSSDWTHVELALSWAQYHSGLSSKFADGIIFGASKVEQAEMNARVLFKKGKMTDEMAKVCAEAGEAAKFTAEPYFRGYGSKSGVSDKYLAMF